ncbi:MAG TPA: hypothetical protein VK957_22260, partial [Lunatimonas sp.]|nr:hypothetical protein [Lunatimonas sp.]
MKNILLLKFCILLALPMAQANILNVNIPLGTHHSQDSLPNVLADQQSDLLGTSLKNQAMIKFATHLLPDNLEDWNEKREEIRNEIILHSGLKTYSNLPLNMRETGSKTMDGYTVKNIYFQTLPGVYATANLYIPEGQGPFPAVVSMHGHWSEGKIAESVQSLGHSMAKNGYVSLVIDAFGAGERTTIHGDFEYHG